MSTVIQPEQKIALKTQDWSLSYGSKQALNNINLLIPEKQVTAFIGPSGCGKSSLLRCYNRMNDLVDGVKMFGNIFLYEEDIYAKATDASLLRQQVGMVFQKPNPFPKSIFENVAYGLRLQGQKNKTALRDSVEWALKGAGLWKEVADRLQDNALGLSGGQQQRVVIARAIAVQPKVLLLDEPTSALDPLSTLKIEELIMELKQDYTIVIVTHNMQQAARVSNYTAFLYLGDLIEYNKTHRIFQNPAEKQTENYISGRFG